MMDPVIYERYAACGVCMNPSAVDELVRNNTTMPDVERVIFNLSKADVMKTVEVEENGKKIKKQEKKLQDLEDRYYKQFSAMEKAMSELNSKQSSLSGLFGS